MRKFIVLIFILGLLLSPQARLYAGDNALLDSTTITTFILVRHAEKADQSPNTNLSEAGQRRAVALSKLLSKVKVDAVYTTPLNRTQQTARLVAENNKLTIETYDMDSNFPTMTDQLAKKYVGKTVLIVGHSNTLPINIARLTKNKEKVSIAESEFDNVYIIQVHSDVTAPHILHLKYGE